MKLSNYQFERLVISELQNTTGGKLEIESGGSNSSRHSCYTNMPDADAARIDTD